MPWNRFLGSLNVYKFGLSAVVKGRGVTRPGPPHLFLKQASGQIFKDDLNVFPHSQIFSLRINTSSPTAQTLCGSLESVQKKIKGMCQEIIRIVYFLTLHKPIAVTLSERTAQFNLVINVFPVLYKCDNFVV
jgi:hypothetical protein